MKKPLCTLLAFIALSSYGQSWIEQQKLKAPTPKENDKYAISLAKNDRFLFVSASLDDEAVANVDDETNSNAGAVYVYDKNNNEVFQKILPSRATQSAYFGNNINASNSYLVVGSYYGKKIATSDDKEGLAYLYSFDETENEWKEVKKLQHENPQNRDLFGRDVSVYENNVLITAHGNDDEFTNSGAAYIFNKDEGGINHWGQQAILKPDEPQANAYFGWSADLYEEEVVIGSYYYDHDGKNNSGAAYVFKKSNQDWTQAQKLIPDDVKDDDKFGFAIALSENYLVISSPYAEVNGIARTGKVYVYKKTTSDQWEVVHTFTSPEPQEREYYGLALAVKNEKILIAAKGYNGKKGRAYLYELNNDEEWEYSIFEDENGEVDDEYGISLILEDETIVIGADDTANNEGAIYKYDNQLFSENTQDVKNVFYATTDWADFDNDGAIDYVVSGALDTDNDHSPDQSVIVVYKNTNGSFEEMTTSSIYGLHTGAVKFIDIDNDGDQDLITTGFNYTDVGSYRLQVYENDNSIFSLKEELSNGTAFGSLDVGDFDNDGDLDLLITGAVQSNTGMITKIMNNENGSFVNNEINFPGVQNGTAKFGDFDNDNDLDIILMGLDSNGNYILKTYQNTNGSYVELQNLPGMYLGSLDLADYDSDGDLDFAIIGDDTDDNYASFIYENINGTFVEKQRLKGIDISSGTNPLDWGDFDNDGDLDILISGSDEDYNDVTVIYRNQGSNFELIENELSNVGGNTSVSWVDIDLDKDLDAFVSGWYTDLESNYTNGTYFHTNLCTTINTAPETPINLEANFSEDQTQIIFEWDAPVDDHTPANGLRYLLRVGSSENEGDIMTYEVTGTSWKLNNIPFTDIFWTVQAIDGSNVKSEIATNITLSIDDIIANQENKLLLYPNPTKGVVYITNSKSILEVSMYTISGQKIDTIEINKEGTIDISAIATGMYFCKIKTAEGTIIKKINKIH